MREEWMECDEGREEGSEGGEEGEGDADEGNKGVTRMEEKECACEPEEGQIKGQGTATRRTGVCVP